MRSSWDASGLERSVSLRWLPGASVANGAGITTAAHKGRGEEQGVKAVQDLSTKRWDDETGVGPGVQVRGDHGEVVNLLVAAGAKVRASSGALIDLQTTQLARCGARPPPHFPRFPGPPAPRCAAPRRGHVVVLRPSPACSRGSQRPAGGRVRCMTSL